MAVPKVSLGGRVKASLGGDTFIRGARAATDASASDLSTDLAKGLTVSSTARDSTEDLAVEKRRERNEKRVLSFCGRACTCKALGGR